MRRLDARTLTPVLVRLVAGVIFVSFSVGKFANHGAEAASFVRYGIPLADATTYLVGVVELVGGAMLLVGYRARLAALVLAGDMVGAILTAGRVEGGPIHLGLAPALLVGMLFLLWAGAGRWTLGRVRPAG